MFEVFKRVDNSRNGEGNDIRIHIVEPIALLSNFILTTSGGKHLGDKNHAH